MSAVIPAPRLLNFLALLGCIAAMAGALYLQHVDGLEPCPLCIFQRVGVMAAALVLLVASLHGPKRIGVRLYGLLTALAAIGGGAVAIRHIWLQSLPQMKSLLRAGPGIHDGCIPNAERDPASTSRVRGMCRDGLGLHGAKPAGLVTSGLSGLLLLALIQIFRPPR